MLFHKRVVHTKFDIYVLLLMIKSSMWSIRDMYTNNGY